MRTGVSPSTIEGNGAEEENRYARLFRQVCRNNATTVAKWQAYGFVNGVLNTDNTSCLGLSLDFGPFAFLDNFDPNYTPNHDDYTLRYSYRNQPAVIWWNLVRLGETLGELIGAGSKVDEAAFIKGTSPLSSYGKGKDLPPDTLERAETVIQRAGYEYKAVFTAEYRRLMRARLGFIESSPISGAGGSDEQQPPEQLVRDLLDMMEALELDFHHFFRRLSNVDLHDLDDADARLALAERFFHHEGVSAPGVKPDEAKQRVSTWLSQWKELIVSSNGEKETDQERQQRMKAVNPKVLSLPFPVSFHQGPTNTGILVHSQKLGPRRTHPSHVERRPKSTSQGITYGSSSLPGRMGLPGCCSLGAQQRWRTTIHDRDKGRV